VELRDSLQERLGTNLPATVAFDYPTISALTVLAVSLAPADTVSVPNVSAGAIAATLQMEVQGMVDALLGKDVPADFPLMDAGLDSLGTEAHPLKMQCSSWWEGSLANILPGVHTAGVVELRNAIVQRIGMDVPTTFVFDNPTIRSITSALLEQEHGNVALAQHQGVFAPHAPPPTSSVSCIVGVSARFPPAAASEIH
jgi:hypothetical protein